MTQTNQNKDYSWMTIKIIEAFKYQALHWKEFRYERTKHKL